MKKSILLPMVTFAAGFAGAAAQDPVDWVDPNPSKLVVSADCISADRVGTNVTAFAAEGTLIATGHVHAVAKPISLLSELIEKKGNEYHLAPGSTFTTCTNEPGAFHWSGSGELTYRHQHAIIAKNMTLRLFGCPVLWFPYWYYPLDTHYGLRVMPGYTSRWGGYLLTRYVYPIAGSFDAGAYGLSGDSRLDWRAKNGIAVGQGFHWQLGDFGRGQFKAYYAWDQDADHYDHYWSSGKHWHYSNWGSDVPDRRYALMLRHTWFATERDTVRLQGAYYSDSHFRGDFLKDGLFGARNRYVGNESGNELAWEHVENPYGLGVSVSGPLNDFYGGTARLPEVFLDVAPQPLFELPVNYESSTRLGYLNRDYAKYGDRTTALPYRYSPGEWADFQAFRADTYHRLTLPFKVADVLSVVPRVGIRGTYWSATGYENLDGYGRAGTSGEALRMIYEGGVTFNARGTAWLNEDWQHLVEPYLDVLAQEAHYSGLHGEERPYVFDSIDASRDYLDQFAGRSRNLPYTWYGVTPGLRNAFRTPDEKGRLRTIFDVDVYAAVQLNDTDWTQGGRYHRLARHVEDPNYGSSAGIVMPGLRARWTPADDIALLARVEFDTENDTVAYADLSWRQVVSRTFKYTVSYFGRDHRNWDFSSTPFDAAYMRNEDFNWSKFGYLEVTAEHDLCDAVAWGPFVRWDCREGEIDEIGSWLDLRTDCLGFRFSVSYENEYTRIDNSKADDDWRFGFFIYLRALGPASGSPF